MKNLVSIIIPNYNGFPYLKDTLESIFKQEYTNIEVIIIDDGSSDGSMEYLLSLNNDNLIVKSNPKKGACAARNYGLSLSKGDYIQFMDADDLLSPKKIYSQVKALKNNEDCISVCHTAHFYDDPSKHKITDYNFLYTTNKPKEFLLKLYGADGKTHNMVQTNAWLTPKILIDKVGIWDESLSKDQDGEFFCRIVANSAGVIFVPEVFNYYRKHSRGTNIASQKKRIHLESQIKALESKTTQFNGLEHTSAYNNAMALQYKIIAIDAYPSFKDLSRSAILSSNTFGGSTYLPVLGGRIVELVKHVFGWKLAKTFSFVVHKYILK